MICQALANKKIANAEEIADIMLAMEFTTWLFEKMKNKGWTQSELATRAGVTETAISDVLSQRRKPGKKLCIGIARALDLPPEQVFRAAGLFPPAPPHTEYIEQLVYKANLLNENGKKELMDYVDFLILRYGKD